jgi:hypothetical protein
MGNISIILLNWKRLNNVINNINHYMSYRLVDEIIIFNNNPGLDLKKISNSKVTVIESSGDMGLYTRFAAAGLAKNSCILHCDDDILIPEITVNELYKHWLTDQTICHGLEGRFIFNEYNTLNSIGNVHVVLTRCMMVSKANCLNAFAFAGNFDDLQSEPKGNGEDIILSYISMFYSKKFNKTYRLKYLNYPDYRDKPDGTSDSIHRKFPRHIQHRTAVIGRCKTLLGI